MTYNEYKFIPGQRLLLELHTELIEGDYDSGSKDRIDLINIIDRLNNIKVKDKLSFYRNEVVEIRCLSDSDTNNTENVLDVTEVLNKTESGRLVELTLNFIYINKPNEEYKRALNRLENSENIGVVGLSRNSHEIDKIRILVVSVADQIYMFDILDWPGMEIPSELSSVLSSQSIRKVVHNSKLLKARLLKCHNVELNNIFDTQVADCLIGKSESCEKPVNPRELCDCLRRRLCLPPSLLEQIENVDTETWDKRPLDFYQLRQASFLATYLLTLKNHLKQMMLKHFHNSVSISANSLRNSSFYQSHTASFLNTVPDEQKTYLEKENHLFP